MYKTLIHDEIIEYFANCTTRFNDKARELINTYDDEWWVVVDTEEENLFLEEIVQELLDMGDIWEYNFTFHYLNKTNDYTEYDGFLFNAPDEKTAWELFLGYDGEYGIADEKEYECIKNYK